LAALIYLRWQPIYWLLVGLACVVAFFALAQVFLSNSLAAILSFFAAAVPVVFLLRISEDFMKDRERILCAPDKGVRTHSAFYARGREYARQGMWALAVIHLRRAVAGAPTMVGYHLALARAYAGLRHCERAESVLHEAQRLAPDHPDLRAVADLIAAARAREQGAKRSTA
jgi:tetratricopeptide (TPR) repeat protein